jgi:hypothetical protein
MRQVARTLLSAAFDVEPADFPARLSGEASPNRATESPTMHRRHPEPGFSRVKDLARSGKLTSFVFA